MSSPLESFREAWQDVRKLTYEFVGSLPAERWSYSPHPAYAPLCKQVRHLVCVQGVYQQGFVEGRADFARKHEHYRGSLERAELLAALLAKDAELDAILGRMGDAGAARFELDFFGRKRSFSRYAAILVQHESIHHGEWALYAALGGFSTPPGWKLNWGL
jgi:DinB superfamily